MTDERDRDRFETELLRPPHVARMLEHAGHFVEQLEKADKEWLIEKAMDRLFSERARIHESQDVLTLWIDALRYAARLRPRWKVWFNVCESRWVQGTRLGSRR